MDPVTEIHTADAVWIKENGEWKSYTLTRRQPISSLLSYLASVWGRLSSLASPSSPTTSFVDYSAEELAQKGERR